MFSTYIVNGSRKRIFKERHLSRKVKAIFRDQLSRYCCLSDCLQTDFFKNRKSQAELRMCLQLEASLSFQAITWLPNLFYRADFIEGCF